MLGSPADDDVYSTPGMRSPTDWQRFDKVTFFANIESLPYYMSGVLSRGIA
ncbi:MAG: hypothetical protein NPIRA01_39140 [Nitrospirales bacterium]|nr:MAG: hypothetical protein NPIRA01_39140 [Nitrospirales bacterium]